MSHTLRDSIGFDTATGSPALSSPTEELRLREFVNLKLAARGHDIVGDEKDFPFLDLGRSLLAKFQEQTRLLADHLCPADDAIDRFIRDYLGDEIVKTVFSENPEAHLVPSSPLFLERHGISRMLSLPPDADSFQSSILSSYRVHQGVCHNPKSDRRTTAGVFHVTGGGLPVPADKKAVPQLTFAHLLKAALSPPDDLMVLPFTGTSKNPARVFVSLLLRPVISPEVPGVSSQKSMEVRFFAPGNLVSNLDFVESIFGNAGDPFLPENDARLDIDGWSGHTGAVILAPHLVKLTKKQVGLPHISQATDRQRADRMCWEKEDELYNDGSAFKITARDTRGTIVTLIADNYYGYCKKEVKTQISYATNLYGNCEEEHAGGAVAYPSYDLGEDFSLSDFKAFRPGDHTFKSVIERYGELMHLQPEGYGIDATHPDILYVPEDTRINLHQQTVSWENAAGPQSLQLQPDITYVLPSGYKIEMVKPTEGQRWRLVGTNAEGTFCHKPCTVSGGGKSEISKSLSDAMIAGPMIVGDLAADLEAASQILGRDFADRYKKPLDPDKPSRPLLAPERSLGSVIRLLTHNAGYTDAYNAWLSTIPRVVRDLVFVIKRFYKPDWGDFSDWKDRFSVDLINGQHGNALAYRRRQLVTQYLRVGFTPDGTWRTFSLRKDFAPALKIQTEDDISASTVVPAEALDGVHPEVTNKSLKFITNCEYRLFQRPDDAVIRGYDKKTESDFSQKGTFFSNYEPIDRPDAKAMVADAIRFEAFTDNMRHTLSDFAIASSPDYVISTHLPRIVDGKPTKNPRYLQNRLDLENPRASYLASIGARFYRRLSFDAPVHTPVNAVLTGRRNNPADPENGIRPLAVYGPVHYQELPELFMDFVASLTGKSPSTTGAGSEGALTKGPFNALLPVHDLNAALVSFILTEYHGFSSAAGHIGRKYRFDHDISLLVPEVWSRMFIKERDPKFLIDNGYLEKIEDIQHDGKTVHASRLGYRINESFVATYFGRVFSAPDTVFTGDMLRPEEQSIEDYADGINNITETQQRVAEYYFQDGSVELACPPLKALLHIMAKGDYEGKTETHPDIRALFTRENLETSDWYAERLDAKAQIDRALWQRHLDYLTDFQKKPVNKTEQERLKIKDRLAHATTVLDYVSSPTYREKLNGTLGTDPSLLPPA